MKNKILITAVLGVLISSPSFAQVTKKVLELPEFKSIYVNSNYTVYLKQTNKQEVSVEALSEIFQLSDIKVENGILMINIDRKPENPNKSIWSKIDDIKMNPTMKLYISMKNINELQVNGNGKIMSENSLASGNLNLAVNGGGLMDLDLKGDIVKVEISGTGTMLLKGYATTLDAVLSGSGNLQAFGCPFETAKIKVSGSGNCEVNVINNIGAFVVGSGWIKHKGNTKNAVKKIYGSGSIDRAY